MNSNANAGNPAPAGVKRLSFSAPTSSSYHHQHHHPGHLLHSNVESMSTSPQQPTSSCSSSLSSGSSVAISLPSSTGSIVSASPSSSKYSPILKRSNGSPMPTNESTIRKVHLAKSHDSPSGGLTLCGGLEAGLPGTIYISRVEESSAADKLGLRAGDQILSINYSSLLDPEMTCAKAMELLCTANYVSLNILSRSEAISGIRRNWTYSWIDPEGRAVSPPPSDRDIPSDPEMDHLLCSTGSASATSASGAASASLGSNVGVSSTAVSGGSVAAAGHHHRRRSTRLTNSRQGNAYRVVSISGIFR